MKLQQTGRYRLVRRLAQGGMGEVWQAVSQGPAGFERTVAIKVIRDQHADRPEVVTSFVNEARLCASLQHPNVVATLDFGFESGQYFIVMELVDGVPLRACLEQLWRNEQSLDLDLALHIARETAAGLHYAHQASNAQGPMHIVHRDVKPSNLLISHAGEVKLADFGVAKTLVGGLKTATGSLKGTFAYMSPEQAGGEKIDARSDVYSLGLVLYEMVCQQRALVGSNEMELLANARSANFAPLVPELPDGVAEIIGCCLQRDPADRYQDAGVLRDELARLLGALPQRDRAIVLGELVSDVRPPAPTERPLLAAGAVIGMTAHADTRPVTAATKPMLGDNRSPDRPRWAALPVVGGIILLLVLGGIYATGVSSQINEDAASHTDAAQAAQTSHDGHTNDQTTTHQAPTLTLEVSADASGSAAATKRARRRKTASGKRGTLLIQVRPWGRVWIDGREVGETPLPPIEVKPGRHVIVAKHPSGNTRRRQVRIRAGERRLLKISLAVKGHQ